jgi:large subunit ribosomal protein L35
VSGRAGHALAARKANRSIRAKEIRKMPKMKTKSGAKKRFKFTAKGKIKTHQVGKRHRLISNSPARTRDLRGTALLSESETQRVKRWMPYGGGF